MGLSFRTARTPSSVFFAGTESAAELHPEALTQSVLLAALALLQCRGLEDSQRSTIGLGIHVSQGLAERERFVLAEFEPFGHHSPVARKV